MAEERISLGRDDVVLQLKYGDDEEFGRAIIGLTSLRRGQVIEKVWTDDHEIVPILLNRLSSCKPNDRAPLLGVLKALAQDSIENKQKMVDVGSLSELVKSLTRDVDECREAMGLLLELSEISSVKRKIGRIQGCIVLLVTILNGDDPIASQDAQSLLTLLSVDAQNALHMAEAGYFRPLVHHLKQGSGMSKILMATALTRIELMDQSKVSLGDDGAVELLVHMFKTGNLESKLSALKALQNLLSVKENVKRLISSGIVVSLLQLLFSVTSALVTLQEPASAILARIAQSDTILAKKDVALQMLSLLTLSSPVIQYHLLQALNSIASQPNASKIRRKMVENGAVHLILSFLSDKNIETRIATLNVLYSLSKDCTNEFVEQIGATYLRSIISTLSSSTSEIEKAAAIGIISNLNSCNKEIKSILDSSNLMPIMISTLSSKTSLSTPATGWLAESISSILVQFTIPSDKKLQLVSAEHGVIPLLVKLLSSGSVVARSRAATSLAQLSQNSVALRKSRIPGWTCMPPSAGTLCEVHDGYCSAKTTFCLVKADAVRPLIQILEGSERDADESVLNALATLLQDDILENGCNYIAKMSGAIEAVIRVLEVGNIKTQGKAIWILERIFRIDEYKSRYGPSAQGLLIDLAQNGDPLLKPTVAKLLAQLELLQLQSSYF